MPARLAKPVAALLIVLLAAGCAHRPGVGSYLDGATTLAAIESTRLEEANPLFSSLTGPQAFIATIAVKHGMKYAIAPLAGRHTADRAVEAGGVTAGGWNLALLVGAPYGLAAVAGLVAGVAYWRTTAQENRATPGTGAAIR